MTGKDGNVYTIHHTHGRKWTVLCTSSSLSYKWASRTVYLRRCFEADTYFRDVAFSSLANTLSEGSFAQACVKELVASLGDLASRASTFRTLLKLVEENDKAYWPLLSYFMSVSELMAFMVSELEEDESLEDKLAVYLRTDPKLEYHEEMLEIILNNPEEAVAWLRKGALFNPMKKVARPYSILLRPTQHVEIFMNFLTKIITKKSRRGRITNKDLWVAPFSAVDGGTIRLAPRGSANAAKLEVKTVEDLRKGHTAPLDLIGERGLSIGPKWTRPRDAGGSWSYIELGVGATSNPMTCSYDGEFFSWNDCHGEYVFDIDGWRFEDGNRLLLLKGIGEKVHSTKNHGDNKGRRFVINDDGTISPSVNLDLVLAVCMPLANFPSSFSISGWSGYNARFNGMYKISDETKADRPIYTHVHKGGVGAGHDWCRMWYHEGMWRIGHKHWVKNDPARCIACAKAPRGSPTLVEGAAFFEHKGEAAGKDHGISMTDFKKASESIILEENNDEEAKDDKDYQSDRIAGDNESVDELIKAVAVIPKLLENLITVVSKGEDTSQDEMKQRILDSVLVRRVAQEAGAIKGSLRWVKFCLGAKQRDKNGMKVKSVSEAERKSNISAASRYFKLLSSLGDISSEFSNQDGFTEEKRAHIVNTLGKAFDAWLPLVLQLTQREITTVADYKIVRDVLDEKLTMPLAMLVVMLDGIAIFASLVTFVCASVLMVSHTGDLTFTETLLLLVAVFFNTYILIREALQAMAMKKVGSCALCSVSNC